MKAQPSSSPRRVRHSTDFDHLLFARGTTLQQALDAFQQGYSPRLKVMVRRGQVADGPPSAFMKQR